MIASQWSELAVYDRVSPKSLQPPFYRPKNIKDIQKFLGLTNYYRRFVKDFATIAKPLHWLVKKNKRWNWGEKQENVFQDLKKIFTAKPVLVVPITRLVTGHKVTW